MDKSLLPQICQVRAIVMLGVYIILSLSMNVQAKMEGFIVGGSRAVITKYPYTAFMSASCFVDEDMILNWSCGASILNQKILLTAGHCVYSCRTGTYITIHLASVNKMEGKLRSASSYILHEKYEPFSNSYDIAMIKMAQPVKFASMLSRVAIIKNPPYEEPGNLAGWGAVDVYNKQQTDLLIEIDQKVWDRKACLRLFITMPIGTICASSKNLKSYAAIGDSGSALTVRGYIQIGLVSYKVPSIAANVIVYTDIGFHYEWIRFNARRLYCSYGIIVRLKK